MHDSVSLRGEFPKSEILTNFFPKGSLDSLKDPFASGLVSKSFEDFHEKLLQVQGTMFLSKKKH